MAEKTNSKWTIDATHSEAQFKVKHLAISNVSGTFKDFSGEVKSENEDFTGAEIKFEIDTNSIDSNNAERDKHLKSPLFLDSEKFPKIIFNGSIQKREGTYKLEGNLTMLETTKSIQMDVDYTGTGTGRFGDVRAGFEVNGKVNRKDFGLSFTLLTEAGNLVVGEDVKLHFDIQVIKQMA
jgi:polyisoprenoid-binding protein YceI